MSPGSVVDPNTLVERAPGALGEKMALIAVLSSEHTANSGAGRTTAVLLECWRSCENS
jgi:hypothetical protein